MEANKSFSNLGNFQNTKKGAAVDSLFWERMGYFNNVTRLVFTNSPA